jgi:hypothetical protein
MKSRYTEPHDNHHFLSYERRSILPYPHLISPRNHPSRDKIHVSPSVGPATPRSKRGELELTCHLDGLRQVLPGQLIQTRCFLNSFIFQSVGRLVLLYQLGEGMYYHQDGTGYFGCRGESSGAILVLVLVEGWSGDGV